MEIVELVVILVYVCKFLVIHHEALAEDHLVYIALRSCMLSVEACVSTVTRVFNERRREEVTEEIEGDMYR